MPPATAALMNEWFVNVKVDREERPDIDAIYMRALQAMGRRSRLADDDVFDAGRKAFLGRNATPRVAQLDQAAAERDSTDAATVKQKSTQSIAAGRYGEPSEFVNVAAFWSAPAPAP